MNAPEASLQTLLRTGAGRAAWRRPLAWAGVAIAALVLAVAAWFVLGPGDNAGAPRYLTEPVTRGDLLVKVIATGTLQPTNKAQIGSELSGTVARVYVDVNDRVRQGQVLAELDTARLRDQVARSRAGVAVAQAAVRQADATVREAQGNLQRLQEVARLSGGKVPSQPNSRRPRPRSRGRSPPPPAPRRAWPTRARRSAPTRPTCARPRSARPWTAWCCLGPSTRAMRWPHRCRR